MKKFILLSGVSLSLLAASGIAAGVTCEELKNQVVKKIEGKGVKNYELEVVPKNTKSSDRVVGSCDKGSQVILYRKTKTASTKE